MPKGNGVILSWKDDPLASVERVAFAEELSSAMRHATRNKLAIIRNASTYIRRRLGDTEAWKKDPRIESFYKMMEAELANANDLLEPRELMTHVFVRKVERLDASESVRMAAASARVDEAASRSIRVTADRGWVTVDGRELALAIRCFIENAAQAIATRGAIHVSAGAANGRYLIEVADDAADGASLRFEEIAQPFFTTKPGHVGLGINVARRIARRYGGDAKLGPSVHGGVSATISLPLRGEDER